MEARNERFRNFNYCNACSIKLDESAKKCSKCKKVYYCSTACQKTNWKKHKIECTVAKKERVDLKDVVFMLGHSFIKDEVFRLPDDVNILTYSKCGESLVSAISMDKCDTLDRCEIGTKPHLYRGSRNNVINNMYFNT